MFHSQQRISDIKDTFFVSQLSLDGYYLPSGKPFDCLSVRKLILLRILAETSQMVRTQIDCKRQSSRQTSTNIEYVIYIPLKGVNFMLTNTILCVQHLMLFQEQSTLSQLLAEMTPDQKVQYEELEATGIALREEVEQARTQIDHLSREKDEFAKEISGSQVINSALMQRFFWVYI